VTDSVIRAMTDDGGFRVVAARTTDTVRGVVLAQRSQGTTARLLADLVTGTILVRETMAPTLRVQGVLKGAEGSTLVADSAPEGGARGLVRLAKDAAGVTLGDGALLQMMRSMPNGELHRGVVEVGRGGGVSEALMAYMQSSEQIVSMISVGARVGADGAVTAAAGYVVQLLPELAEGPLAVMTERLREFVSIEPLLDGPARSPDALVGELLFGMPFTRLAEAPLRFECSCSAIRVMASLSTLPKRDIAELLEGGKAIDLSCDYCGKAYEVDPERLRGLLDTA
jgi:molecular chaperone Hsp33